jgi:hypothetical protein
MKLFEQYNCFAIGGYPRKDCDEIYHWRKALCRILCEVFASLKEFMKLKEFMG